MIYITILMILPLVLLVNTELVYAQLEGGGWQKGVEATAGYGTSAVKMEFSIPNGKAEANSSISNYVFLWTDTGDFIQAGFIYDNTYHHQIVIPGSTFYSDGFSHFNILHPYRKGILNEVIIRYDDGWKILFRDTEVNYESQADVDWATGTRIVKGGMILENTVVDRDDIILKIEEFGSLSNVKDQRFYFLSNGNWYTPENIVYGYDVEREFESKEWMIYQIPPPEWTLFKKIGDSFEVGIQEQLKTEIQFDENKMPEWVRNIFIWYGQGTISEGELINALQFLIKEGILKV